MSDALLGHVDVPTLLVVGTADTTTPPEVDADRPWALLRTSPVWRLDLEGCGAPGLHQHSPLCRAGAWRPRVCPRS